MEKIYLTDAEYKKVIDTIENPPPVADKLKAAADAYKKAQLNGQ